MSFFSNLFKCCESNATIQHEANNELIVAIRSDNRSPSFAIIDTKTSSIQPNKKSQFSQNISESKEKQKEKVDNHEIKFKNRIESKSPSFINIVLKPENKNESTVNDGLAIVK